jgi:hypothetical protein
VQILTRKYLETLQTFVRPTITVRTVVRPTVGGRYSTTVVVRHRTTGGVR